MSTVSAAGVAGMQCTEGELRAAACAARGGGLRGRVHAAHDRARAAVGEGAAGEDRSPLEAQ